MGRGDRDLEGFSNPRTLLKSFRGFERKNIIASFQIREMREFHWWNLTINHGPRILIVLFPSQKKRVS